MSELLDLAINAHGGWDNWQKLKRITANFSAAGSIWALKGRPGAFADARLTLDPHQPEVEYVDWPQAGEKGVYQPQQTSIVPGSSEAGDVRKFPRQAFAGHTITTPWDLHNSLYFAGYAMWTYLTTPFLFKLPGFQVQEIDPWNEDGQEWRRLKVRFPIAAPSHSSEQTFYFDSAGVLQRHDYSVDIMGGTSSCHYSTEHKVFGGLLFPTRRRVYARDAQNKPIRDRVAVSIDIHSIDLA